MPVLQIIHAPDQQDFKISGVSVFLVEQKLTIAMKVSHRVCVVGHGRIVFEGPPRALHDKPDVMENWLVV